MWRQSLVRSPHNRVFSAATKCSVVSSEATVRFFPERVDLVPLLVPVFGATVAAVAVAVVARAAELVVNVETDVEWGHCLVATIGCKSVVFL
jgi:hypothetical protein